MNLSIYKRFFRSLFFGAGTLITVLAAGNFNVNAATIVNGGFETGDFTGWTTNFPSPNNTILVLSAATFGPRMHDGSYNVNFSGFESSDRGILSQTFSTILGTTYNVEYWVGAIGAIGTAPSLVSEILGSNGNTPLNSLTHIILGNGGIQYALIQFLFVADGSNATIKFTDTSPQVCCNDMLLDTVSVEAIVTPIPAALPLFAAGLSAMGFMGWRKRRKTFTN